MEEYQNKVNYLRHIKNIADIQDGRRKPTALSSIFNQTHTSIIKAIQESISKEISRPDMVKLDVQDKLRPIEAHRE